MKSTCSLKWGVALGALVAMLGAGGPTPAAAAEVLIKAKGDSTRIKGELVSFEDNAYVLKTRFGTVRIDADRAICEGDACPDLSAVNDVTIAGSETVGEALMPLLLTGFADTFSGVAELAAATNGTDVLASLVADDGYGDEIGTFTVKSSNSADAFLALLRDTAQIGMSSRRITPREARALRSAGGGNMIDENQEHIVAVDSIVVAVHPSNPVSRISMETLDRIYSGGVTNWSEIGGPDLPILALARAPETGTGSTFDERVFAASGRTRSDSLEVVGSNTEMSQNIAANRGAIGYVGHAYKRGTKPLAITSSCGITASADVFSAKTEEYPLQRRLYLYNRADTLSPAGRDFLGYAISKEADGVVAKAGFIDLGIRRVSQDDPKGRMSNLIQNTTDPFEFGLMRQLLLEMLSYDRLSTTFRFSSGSSRLDGKGLLDLERLTDYLATQPAGTEVALVGFTDSDGAFEANQSLSLIRAQQVAETIQELKGDELQNVVFEAKGFGEFSPAACNDTLDGKRINRRVEVWIRKSNS